MNPKLSIISNPPHPDNNRQTILQPASPPDLKMTSEVRLPNVLFGDMAHPRPEIAPPPPAPVASRSQEVLPAPTTGSAPPASTLALAAPPVPVPNPALPLPLPTSRSAPSDPRDARDADRITDLGVPTRNTSSLLSLSVDPAPAVESITLPPGNRRGAFSISPGGDAMGSPGGIAGGDPQGGWGGSGAGGDPSTGIGAGSAGGGGGARALASEGISISVGARAEGGDGGGVLPSFFAATLVYPVRPTHPRRVAMVVTAGPAGGGGLRLYGVLKGGKVYTIYLPMPGRNWILQYCAEDSAARKRVPPPKGIVVRLDPGLVPPSAEEQFDFHRPPWSHQKAGELIILHGVIREDGSVNDLSVVQGLPGAVDQAALAAFARWRFKPALRDGKPVAVEVLVGIPALSSET